MQTVYEGDIVRLDDGTIGEVVWNEPKGECAGGWVVSWQSAVSLIQQLEHWTDKCTVIGNIHDNPQLLMTSGGMIVDN